MFMKLGHLYVNSLPHHNIIQNVPLELALHNVQQILHIHQRKEVLVDNTEDNPQFVGDLPFHHVGVTTILSFMTIFRDEDVLDEQIDWIEFELAECFVEEHYATCREYTSNIYHFNLISIVNFLFKHMFPCNVYLKILL